jgi:peptidoglycan/xylan/chitin deacetylase (PgdA/CDA1 family)
MHDALTPPVRRRRSLVRALKQPLASSWAWPLVTRLLPATAIVLAYHRVAPRGASFPALDVESFRTQMAWIRRECEPIGPGQLREAVARPIRGRVPVLVTFDDGYRDTLTHAAPILARHGVPATVFLASGFIGTADVPWYDRLALSFKLTRERSVMAPWGRELGLDTPAARFRSLEQSRACLKRMPEDAARCAVDTLVARLGVPERRESKSAMLTWDDVHALSGLGFSIGGHTVSHPILSRVSADRAWQEIAGCRAAIAEACGRPPRAFAYPNGGAEDYTAAVVDAVRRAGFTSAATTRFGMNTIATSPWELRRGGPWEAHLPTFALKLAWYRMTL